MNNELLSQIESAEKDRRKKNTKIKIMCKKIVKYTNKLSSLLEEEKETKQKPQ